MDMMDDELEVLQKRLLQKQLTGALQEAPEDSFQQVAPILGGAIDILSRAGIQSADPVEIMTGIKIPRAEPTQAEKSVRAIMADRATKTHQKALDEMTLLKSLDERRRRQMEMALKAQDAASRLALEYDKLASTEGRAAADRALKQALMEQEQKFKTGERIGGESFKKGESQLDRELRLKLAKMQAASTAQKAEKAEKPGMKPGDILKIQEGDSVARLLPDIENTLNVNPDLFDPIKGRLAELNPYNERAQSVNAQMKAASQSFGRYMEGGVLRAEDERKYREMFPKLGDTISVAKSKLAIVQRQLIAKQQADLDALGKAGYDISPFARRQTPEVPEMITKGKPLKQTKPKTVTQGGHTYILNEKTGQYE